MSEAFYAGAWRTLTRAEVYLGNQWRRVTRAEAYINGAWRTIISPAAGPLSLSAPSGVNGYKNSVGTGAKTVTSDAATATPTGGVAPYSYQWTVNNGAVSIAQPTQATTTFSALVPQDSTTSATATVVCTDAVGSTATRTVSVQLTNTYTGTGGTQ